MHQLTVHRVMWILKGFGRVWPKPGTIRSACGGAPLQVSKAWGNNGRAPVKDWLGGGENVRTKDAACRIKVLKCSSAFC